MSTLRAAGRAGRSAFAILAAFGDARLSPSAPRTKRAERMRRLLAEVADIHGLRIAMDPLPAAPCVLVSNHVGYLDPIVIGSRVAMTALAKKEVASWPVIGGAADALGCLWVDRGCTHSRAAALLGAIRALRDGVSVLNFPEGTTTDGARLLPFASGIFAAARLAGVPVVPLAIRYGTPRIAWTGGETFLPHYARTAARSSLSAVVRAGAPIDPAAYPSAGALAVAARHAVATLLRQPPEDHHDPVERAVVPPPRPDAVLPPAERRLRVA